MRELWHKRRSGSRPAASRLGSLSRRSARSAGCHHRAELPIRARHDLRPAAAAQAEPAAVCEQQCATWQVRSSRRQVATSPRRLSLGRRAAARRVDATCRISAAAGERRRAPLIGTRSRTRARRHPKFECSSDAQKCAIAGYFPCVAAARARRSLLVPSTHAVGAAAGSCSRSQAGAAPPGDARKTREGLAGAPHLFASMRSVWEDSTLGSGRPSA